MKSKNTLEQRSIRIRFQIISTILLFFSIGNSYSQCLSTCGVNLISNPGFETMSSDCGTANSEMFTDYSQAQDWMGTACLTCPGNGSTPDYYNSLCTGAAATENCGTSDASVGFFTSVEVGGTGGTNSREYVQSQLGSTLVAGKEYCISVNVKTSPGSIAYVPSDGLGFWFTDQMVDIDVDNGGQQFLGPGSVVNATPQVANPAGNIIGTTCTVVTGTFIATGNEDWIVIGNFRPDNVMQTTSSCGGLFTFCFGYLIIDDLSLKEVCTGPCDATISPAGPFCLLDAASNLSAAGSGGSWTGTGITDAVNGTFNPAIAGAGSHIITYTLLCGDVDTETIVVNAMDDSSFTFTQAAYCLGDADPTPTVTGLSGGTFSINNGGTINISTGEVDLTSSGAGSYTISYTTNGQCPTIGTFDISISSSFDATINSAGPFCLNDAATNLTAVDNGGSWSGTGITNATNGTFDPTVAGVGSHIITYTISGSCGDTDTETIVVTAMDDPSFTYPQNLYCLVDTDPIATVSGLSGGTFSIDNSGTINTSTGEIDITASGVGGFIITYTTNGSCPTNTTFNITISSTVDATINAISALCENDAAVDLTSATAGGVWSGTGITNATNGTFDPTVAGPGSHVVTYTISGSCGDTDTETIVVIAMDDASFSYTSSTYCVSETNPSPTVSGLAGGVFSINNGGSINASTGEIDLALSGLGSFTITYLTNGACPASATTDITIISTYDATISQAGPFCETDGQTTLSATDTSGVWTGNGIVDANTGVFNPSIAGVGAHQIIYTIPGNCGDSDTITIDVNSNPIIILSPNVTISYGSSTELVASGGGSYNWSPPTDLTCTNCDITNASPLETTTYCVEVSLNSCVDTACVTVTIDLDCGEVYIPNAFSPNGDTENDLVCVFGNCIASMNLVIYDRWGEKVFESTSTDVCWDGNYRNKPLNSGVYVYVFNGTLISGEEISKKGNISLFK